MTISNTLLDRTRDCTRENEWLVEPFKQDLAWKAIKLAIEEDLGQELKDPTTDAIIDPKLKAQASIWCKEQGAKIVGLPVANLVFQYFDKDAKWVPLVSEGTAVLQSPMQVATIVGNARAILIAERIALNLLQRMSGIATITSKFTEKAAPFQIAILDTRKTIPGLRVFERYAVKLGGGINHRFGLYDAILIKDNHIQIAGGISNAVALVRDKYPLKKIEVECSNLQEVHHALRLKVDSIMLDNMSPDLVSKALELSRDKCFIEVSGGITLENLDGFLQPGVNAISIGALTHSAKNVDLSLEVEKYL